MHRRQFLAAGATTATIGLAGCRSMFQTRSARAPPLVEDRPDAVYYPTHVEGMEMVSTAEAGDYGVGLFYSFPHRFWLMDGDTPNKVEIRGEDSLHLMSTVWDRETNTVVPNSSVSVTIEKDGESVVEKTLWAMLSQNMGVHAGDNLALEGDGTYDVTLAIGPLSARRTGAFADRFDERVTASFTLEFQQSTTEDISFERLTSQQGDRGAVDPMEMQMIPISQLPAVEDLPGTTVGTGESGGATFVAKRLSSPPESIDSDGSYLAVSPRTPYNRYPLPRASLSATVTRDGGAVFDDALPATFDPDLGYHYGAVADLQSGDEVTVSVSLPPQVARHEGYETAFLDFDDLSMTA